MQKCYSLPYGKSTIDLQLDSNLSVDLILPTKSEPVDDEISEINNAIRNPIINNGLPDILAANTRIVITINDKTRPVPNNVFFPPLIDSLLERGAKRENISIIIASGTHAPMKKWEIPLIIDPNLIEGIKIFPHNCDDSAGFTYKGTTRSGTPVYINRVFEAADLRIVVGDIEPHHFAGFSGGSKGAAIGLTSRETINKNHTLLKHPKAFIGIYEENPLRQDIEDIGDLIGVDFALNAVLNEKKQIIKAFFGHPRDVMQEGIAVSKAVALTPISELYDLVIASAGGYPKDINFYQAQKALTHASMFCKQGSKVILIAECIEGVGSVKYLDFVKTVKSHKEVITEFDRLGFNVGPHKALQVALLTEKISFALKSTISDEILAQLLIPAIHDLPFEIKKFIQENGENFRIAVLPYATATIPFLKMETLNE
jgi:lactate racemase